MARIGTKPRLICFVLTVLCLGSLFSFSAAADGSMSPLPSMENTTAVSFFHVESGFSIAQKNVTSPLPAGPTGKIVAGLIACEQLGGRLAEQIMITDDMIAGSEGYRMHLASGDVLSIENLLYAAICGSYNDAFQVLGVLIAGSTQNFINQMNDRAAACGATDTTYAVDISGYRDASVTTAEDTARIALIAAQNELYVKIASASSYRKNGLSIDNRNALISGKETNLYYNAKCRGMSAGYTNRAGNCVVSLYESNGGHYIGVVLGGADGDDGTNHAYALSNSLIRWVDKTYTYLEILSPDTVICTLPVTVSDLTSEIEVKARESIRYFLPADCEVGKDVIYSLRLSYTSLEAPVTEGIPVGYVAILYQGKVIGSATLYTAGSAERSSFVSSLNAMQDLIKSRRFLAGAIFFVVVTTAWLTTEALLLRRRRHRWDKYFSEKLEAPERMARKKPSQPKDQSRPNGK